MRASGEFGPNDIAVDATSVYWVDFEGGTVMKVPLNGGPTTTLASGQASPASVSLPDEECRYVQLQRIADNSL